MWSWGKILGQILKKVKKQATSLGFFHILLEDYLLKQEAVVVKPPDLVKNGKKTDNIQ